jgi:hypothetical protein
VPDQKPTRGEKKQAKRDAKAKGDAKNKNKPSGHRETKGGSKRSTHDRHTGPRSGGPEKKDLK